LADQYCVNRLRAAVAGAALVLVLAAVPAVASTARPTASGTHAKSAVTLQPGLDAAILARINAVRAAHGLRRLRLNARLAAAATTHSRELAAAGLFQHESPNGAAFWKRIDRYYSPLGFRSWKVGENLLWWSPNTDAAATVAGWLASPPHRKNLLNPDWRELGISAIHDPAAPGTYKGLEVTIVTADFGVRTK
jgi:uncharacterized protein YkwD